MSAAAASLAAVAITVTGCSPSVDLAKDRTGTKEQPANSDGSSGGAEATGSGGGSGEIEATGGAADGSGGAPASGTGGYVAEATGGTNGEAAARIGGAGGAAPGPDLGSGGQAESDAGGPFTCPSTCEVAQLRSHGDSLTDPFSIWPGMEIRTCLAFHVETEAPANLVGLTFVLGDEQVLHHTVLRRWSSPLTTGGTVPCPPEGAGQILFQWEPGSPGTLSLPEGTPLGAGDFVLEMHYVNTSALVQQDRTGFDLCDCPR